MQTTLARQKNKRDTIVTNLSAYLRNAPKSKPIFIDFDQLAQIETDLIEQLSSLRERGVPVFAVSTKTPAQVMALYNLHQPLPCEWLTATHSELFELYRQEKIVKYYPHTYVETGTPQTMQPFPNNLNNFAMNDNLLLRADKHHPGLKFEIIFREFYRILGVSSSPFRAYNWISEAQCLALHLPHAQHLVLLTEKHDTAMISTAQHGLVLALFGHPCATEHVAYQPGSNFVSQPTNKMMLQDRNLVNVEHQLQRMLDKQEELRATAFRLLRLLDVKHDKREEFINQLSQRLDEIVCRFSQAPQPYAKIEKVARFGKTAAGVLTYFPGEEVTVLLSRRNDHGGYNPFGGISEDSDITLPRTAVREVQEESCHQLIYTEEQLENLPFHDLVSDRNLFRMYIAPHAMIDLTKLIDHEHTHHVLVPMQRLVDAARTKTPHLIYDGVNIDLFGPFFSMLSQPAVIEQIERLAAGMPPLLRRTLSHENAAPTLRPSAYKPLITNRALCKTLYTALSGKHASLFHIRKPLPLTVVRQPLSPTEVHLSYLLGPECLKDIPEAINHVIHKRQYTPLGSFHSIDELNKLAADCYELYLNEKANYQHRIHFHHGACSRVSFLYDFYSELYRALYADESWHALRVNSEYLRPFNNIIEFLAKFCAQGDDISDHGVEFINAAISTNIFIFGSAGRPGDYSPEFYLTNGAVTVKSIISMISCLCGEVDVEESSLQGLCALGEDYTKRTRGVFYQIAMSYADASQFSYASISHGAPARYELPDGNKTCDLAQILPILSHRSATNQLTERDRSYIHQLQGRVGLWPHAKLHIKRVDWQPLPANEQEAYHEKLRYYVDRILHSILMQRNLLNFLHRSVPLRTGLPIALAQNDLELQPLNEGRQFIAAVTHRHLTTIKALGLHNPAFFYTEIIARYNPFYGNPIMAFPIEYLFFSSDFTSDEIIECAGPHWADYLQKCTPTFIDVLTRKLSPDQVFTLINALGAAHVAKHEPLRLFYYLSSDKYEWYANYLLPYINSEITIANLANKIAEHDKVAARAFLIRHADKMQDVFDLRQVVKAKVKLDQLPTKAEQYRFIRQYDHFITSNRELCTMLRIMPHEYWLTYLTAHGHHMRNVDDVLQFIRSEKLTDIIPPHVYDLLDYSLNRFDSFHALKTICHFQYDQRIETAMIKFLAPLMLAKNLPNQRLEECLFIIAHEDRLPLASRFKNQIQHGMQLGCVLLMLPRAARCAFAIECAEVISTDIELNYVKAILDPAEQSKLTASVRLPSPVTSERDEFYKKLIKICHHPKKIDLAFILMNKMRHDKPDYQRFVMVATYIKLGMVTQQKLEDCRYLLANDYFKNIDSEFPDNTGAALICDNSATRASRPL